MAAGETSENSAIPVWRRQDLVAGIAVMGIAGFALWQGADLGVGTLRQMGAGMLPRALAVLFAALGALLAISALFSANAALSRIRPRGPVMVLAAVIAFGLGVRPLGLLLAGPLTVLIGATASPETRWRETLIFAAVMTALCVGLFKLALGLPIPLAPWLLGY
jgi:putative tricarboxylic transport membrane protein